MTKTPQIKQRKRSPYQRYGKRPFVYSEPYRRWKAAVLEGRHREAREAALDHAKRFAPHIVPHDQRAT